MRHNKIESESHEEELYLRANELSRKHKIPFTEVLIQVSLIRKDGSRELVLQRHSRSLVRNFYVKHVFDIAGSLNAGGYTDGGLQNKDVGGTIRAATDMYVRHNMEGTVPVFYAYADGAGSAAQGIQIGTGTTAESFDDFQIETLIAHGTGGGQMEYGLLAHTKGWNAGSSYYYKNHERVMDNNSGGSINVTESTLIWHSSGDHRIVLMSHDVFSAVAVADGEGIAIFYEFRTTYP